MRFLAPVVSALVLSIPPQTFGQAPVASSGPALSTVAFEQPGSTPFIRFLVVNTGNIDAFRSVQFEVVPKPGSVTRPISAVYYADYLMTRGYFSPGVDFVTVPVFGLYSDYVNTVNLTYRFTDGTALTDSVTVTAAAFDDPHGYNSPTVLQPRSASTALSYDYFSLKSVYQPNSPILVDTDGAVRWAGTTGLGYVSSIFIDNGFLVPAIPAGSDAFTGLGREELDGTSTFLRDLRPSGVVLSDHHNYDAGREGVLVEVDTTDQIESVIYEVDLTGNILRSWNMASIIRAAMTAGGDDPSGFVYDSPVDWFHNNSATYRASDNTLIVSSRENFVIAVDYDSGAIRWILGDSTKHWHEYASLRNHALILDVGSRPPLGQHSVSITHDDNLLLFDNGTGSLFQYPPGEDVTYSSPRKYRINTQAMRATEIWNYPYGQSLYSRLTSSVYEDDPSNYLIDWANITINGQPTYAEFMGLAPSGEKVFDYRYPAPNIGLFAWNAAPIHLENLVFTGPQTALAAGHPRFFTGETALTNGVYYLSFPFNGNVFGYYAYLADPHYLYHFGLGYEYWFDAGDSQRGVYLYDFKSQDIFYTSPQFPFPYLYDFNLSTVLYYFADASTPDGARYFYNFATGEVITK